MNELKQERKRKYLKVYQAQPKPDNVLRGQIWLHVPTIKTGSDIEPGNIFISPDKPLVILELKLKSKEDNETDKEYLAIFRKCTFVNTKFLLNNVEWIFLGYAFDPATNRRDLSYIELYNPLEFLDFNISLLQDSYLNNYKDYYKIPTDESLTISINLDDLIPKDTLNNNSKIIILWYTTDDYSNIDYFVNKDNRCIVEIVPKNNLYNISQLIASVRYVDTNLKNIKINKSFTIETIKTDNIKITEKYDEHGVKLSTKTINGSVTEISIIHPGGGRYGGRYD